VSVSTGGQSGSPTLRTSDLNLGSARNGRHLGSPPMIRAREKRVFFVTSRRLASGPRSTSRSGLSTLRPRQ